MTCDKCGGLVSAASEYDTCVRCGKVDYDKAPTDTRLKPQLFLKETKTPYLTGVLMKTILRQQCPCLW